MVAIEVRDLIKIYPGDIYAVNGATFQIEDGEIFGLLGPNGAGKSTIIKILTTQIKPSQGNAFVQNMDVTTQSQQV